MIYWQISTIMNKNNMQLTSCRNNKNNMWILYHLTNVSSCKLTIHEVDLYSFIVQSTLGLSEQNSCGWPEKECTVSGWDLITQLYVGQVRTE